MSRYSAGWWCREESPSASHSAPPEGRTHPSPWDASRLTPSFACSGNRYPWPYTLRDGRRGGRPPTDRGTCRGCRVSVLKNRPEWRTCALPPISAATSSLFHRTDTSSTPFFGILVGLTYGFRDGESIWGEGIEMKEGSVLSGTLAAATPGTPGNQAGFDSFSAAASSVFPFLRSFFTSLSASFLASFWAPFFDSFAALAFFAGASPVLKSTSSMIATSPPSPKRRPSFTTRVYPPGRFPIFVAISPNNSFTTSRSLMNRATCRRAWTLLAMLPSAAAFLARVRSFSATIRVSFALASVVRIFLCRNSAVQRAFRVAFLWLAVRFSFLPDFRCRMVRPS